MKEALMAFVNIGKINIGIKCDENGGKPAEISYEGG